MLTSWSGVHRLDNN